MQTDNRLLDDIARLASGMAGVAASAREEAEAAIKARLQRLLGEMDLVTREEFDAVQAMAAQARSEQEALAKRVAELERKVAAKPAAKPAPKPAGAKRGAAKGKGTGKAGPS